MIRKYEHYNRLLLGYDEPHAVALERDGHAMRRQAFSPSTVTALREEIAAVYRDSPPATRKSCLKGRRGEMFRYAMFNRSALCQDIMGRREILDVVEPLLGDDCHVIACTAWRNPADPAHAPMGQEWHVDGGPHVVRPEGVEWPDAIPYPVFVIAVHVYLEPCTIADGPTAALSGSHRSGRLPPHDRRWDLDLTYEGATGLAHVAEAGDLTFFVSDVWHRRLPPQPGGTGRHFLQINYGRREIAQRIYPTDVLGPANEEARARARTERERQLLGIHGQSFYDA